jgi:hypothetical protein
MSRPIDIHGLMKLMPAGKEAIDAIHVPFD